MGLVEAIEKGTSHVRGIFEGARRSAKNSYGIVKARAPVSTDSSVNEAGMSRDSDGQPAEGNAVFVDNGGQENYGFEILQGSGLEDLNMPDSWLFTGWDMFGD